MANSTKKLRSLLRLLQTDGPERLVPRSWLFRTGSRIDRKFRASAPITFIDCGDYVQVGVKEQVFLWPSKAPRQGILQILSEILTPMHPHQYLYGHTKLQKDDVVLDIGACEGAFSAIVTSQVRHVVAIEPSQSMCELIRELFRVRHEPCPEIVNCLLGSQPGSAYFFENLSNPGASRIVSEPTSGAYEVPVKTLQEVTEMLRLTPTFIKCDAEGAELAILSGGKEFLKKYRPKLAITTYHGDEDYLAIHSLLTSLGYQVQGKGYFFSGKKLRVQMIHGW